MLIPEPLRARVEDSESLGYFGVDLDLVWDVVASELPAARTRIVDLLEELDAGGRSASN